MEYNMQRNKERSHVNSALGLSFAQTKKINIREDDQ
jgi:hypothetical protein